MGSSTIEHGICRICSNELLLFHALLYAGMRKLRCLLKESSSAVRSQAVSFSDHCFHLYLHDKFRDKLAVHLKAIQE